MKRRLNTFTFSAALLALIFTAAPSSGQTYVGITNLLFFEDFSGYEPGTKLADTTAGGKWGVVTWGESAGDWGVAQDEENAFAQGVTNKFLRVSSTYNLNLVTPDFKEQEVLIYAFDFIGRYPPGDGSRWLNVVARAGGARAHITSFRMSNATIRTAETSQPSYGGNNLPIRVLTVMNNRADTISYDRPDGFGETTLSSTNAAVWIYHYQYGEYAYWEPVLLEYSYSRNTTALGATMNNIRFDVDNNTLLRSFDLDNVAVYGSIAPPAPPILLRASAAGGNIEIRWDAKPGKTYQVRYRTSLSSGAWINLGAEILSTADGEQVFQDSVPADAQRFYQVSESSP
jgi:hypothetical protein